MLERPDAEEETEEEIGELTCDPDNQVGEIEAGMNYRTGNSDDKEGEDRYNVIGLEKQDVGELRSEGARQEDPGFDGICTNFSLDTTNLVGSVRLADQTKLSGENGQEDRRS